MQRNSSLFNSGVSIDKKGKQLLRVVGLDDSDVGLLGSSVRPLLLLRRGVSGESI